MQLGNSEICKRPISEIIDDIARINETIAFDWGSAHAGGTQRHG